MDRITERSFWYMSRTKEFDPAIALQDAMQVFWERGYTNTSIDDLVAATSVSRYGLYATFGGKRDLFLKVLDLYWDHYAEPFFEDSIAKETLTPDGIRNVFIEMLLRVSENNDRNGCMLCNTATELAPFDDVVGAKVRCYFDRIADIFTKALEKAKERGEVGPEVDPYKHGLYMGGIVQALAVQSRSFVDEKSMRDFLEVALAPIC